MTIGEKIQQLRRGLGISQEQLAETLEISRQSVSKWERGEAVPDIEKVVALSRFFGVTTDQLLLDDPQPIAPQINATVCSNATEDRLTALVRENAAHEKLRIGIRLLMLAVVLGIVDCILPFLMQLLDRYINNAWYGDASMYLSKFPLPVLLILTAAVLGLAAWFLWKSFSQQKNENHAV